MLYFETSAKTGLGVNELFSALSEAVYKHIKQKGDWFMYNTLKLMADLAKQVLLCV